LEVKTLMNNLSCYHDYYLVPAERRFSVMPYIVEGK
jgi:hypothetical protein